MSWEDYQLENALYPWLDDPCDDCDECEPQPCDEPWYYCDHCGAGCDDDEGPCPDCGTVPTPA